MSAPHTEVQPKGRSPPGPPQGIKTMHLYATHALMLVREKTSGLRVPDPLQPDDHPGIPLEIRGDLETLTSQVVCAWSNRVKLDFALSEVSDALRSGGSKPRDQMLQEIFASSYPRNPDGTLPLADEPAVFIDRHDRVVAWYIPGAFSSITSDYIMAAVARDRNKALEVGGEQRRQNRELFANPERCLVRPGAGNFSICWYNQGHGPGNSLPAPSASLKSPEGRSLLSSLRVANAIIGALFAVIHPEYYNQQIRVFQGLYDNPEKCSLNPELTEDLFEDWTTPFDVFSIIANRESEFHRDNKGGVHCLDILATFGSYRGGRLEVPLLGRRFVYNPRTAFVMPGYLFEHGACKTDGERLCMASYFRPNVGRGILGEGFQDLPPPTAETLERNLGFRRPVVDEGDIWEL